MPRLPQVRSEALRDLEAQLRFAPTEALLRDIVRAEALAADVESELTYPMSWVVFRITGYRPDGADSMITGTTLLADLSALVERMCVAAQVGADSLSEGSFLTVEELERRWSVSRSTINRHRKRGLVARRVREADGNERLMFSLEAVERHELAHAPSLDRAGSYSRIDDRARAGIVEQAHALAGEGCSLNEAALRIARDCGRSHEAVRQLLRRHDEGASDPVFAGSGQMSERERRLVWRASMRAIEPRRIAAHLGRSDEAVRRAIETSRADVLRRIDRSGALEAPEAIAAAVADEAWVARVLEPDDVRQGLRQHMPTDLLALIEWARSSARQRASATRLLAHQVLRARAGSAVRSLSTSAPSAGVIDRAETDIRWCALLKTQIVRSQMPGVVAAAEDAIDAPLDRLRPGEARDVIRVAIVAASVVIDTHDPGAPLAASLALEVSSALSRQAAMPRAGRAQPRVATGTHVPALEQMAATRLSVLMPRLEPGLGALPESDRALLEERFGYAGPPSTMVEIATRRGVQPMHVARQLRRAWRAALVAGRDV